MPVRLTDVCRLLILLPLVQVIFCSACARAQVVPQRPPEPQPVLVPFARSQQTTLGSSVYVLGNLPELGNGDVRYALKLSPTQYPTWFANLMLPAGRTVQYRYLLREDSGAQAGNAANASFLTTTATLQTTGTMTMRSGRFEYLKSAATPPVLEIREPAGVRRVPFTDAGPGRAAGETRWHAHLGGLPAEPWEFRIDLGGGSFEAPAGGWYRTALDSVWMQDGQVFNYQPAALLTAPRVIKIQNFTGRLSTRPLYVYLPRGYDQHTARRYPVIYMHDGQNDFAAHMDGSPVSWAADTHASRLIAQGLMRECIIVGVSHGGSERIAEYLPPYSNALDMQGRADVTAAYYIEDVKPYIDANYRTLPEREQTATCGSSMGGVFSTYLAWEFNAFAAQHASVSPAYWTTPELVQKLASETPRPMRLWLDSGTIAGESDDGFALTYAVRDALLQQGYVLGPDFWHYVAIGATHTEAAWAARLELIFPFLLPVSGEPGLPPETATSRWNLFD